MLHCYTCNKLVENERFIKVNSIGSAFHSMLQMDRIEQKYYPESSKDNAGIWLEGQKKIEKLTQDEILYIYNTFL